MTDQREIQETFMSRAIELAQRGQGLVEPNPMVGTVIVRNDQIIAEGYHREFGGPHAEIKALQSCRNQGVDPAGGTLYVNLEPCCHHGKTPPCTTAIIEAGINKVVTSMIDPHDKVAGSGIAALREAGIDVQVGLGEQEAKQLNQPFIKRVTTGLPWIIAKWAQTIDGKTATNSGDSKWISNELSRHKVHELRARMDAVMVGINTVLIDDPELTSRIPDIKRIAKRVIIDPELKTPVTAQILQNPNPLVIIAYAQDRTDQPQIEALTDKGVETIKLSRLNTGRLDLKKLLIHLADTHAATNVLVEGGARLIGSLLDQELIDQLIIFQAPKIIGNQNALSSVQGLSCETIASAIQFKLHNTKLIGDDLMLEYRIHNCRQDTCGYLRE